MASYLINNVGINTTTRVEAESLSVEGNMVKFLASQKVVAVRVLAPGDLYEKKATAAQSKSRLDMLSKLALRSSASEPYR
jgi:hypothetical protein